MMKKFFGLFPGRHELPEVQGYVFPATVNPVDFDGMQVIVSDFLRENAGIVMKDGLALNGAEDARIFAGTVEINVYVTGLTAATAALIRGCALNGVSLTLWHFDRESGEYVPQEMF